MSELVLLGGGGHCISILDSVYRMDRYKDIVVLDPDKNKGNIILRSEVMGDDSLLESIRVSGCKYAFISVGSIKDTSLRRKLDLKLTENGYILIKVIDPSAVVSEYSEIMDGVFIGKNCVVNAKTKIGRNAIINTASVIEHECEIGDFTHIACGSVLCGNVKVGNDCFIGAGSKITEGIRIGNNAVIGAGSVVLRDVKDNEVVRQIVK
ncbi:MAG: acetyltransferase [Eubacterium sp.]|nr:acetyltransferase [Eubacterium sp.]